MLLLAPGLDVVAGNTGNRTMQYAWLLFLKKQVEVDVIVAVGDSITVGSGDSDCELVDIPGTCSGYTTVLRDLLTASRGYEHTIWKEGESGQPSAYGRGVIQSIIDAHPEADQYLVMYGTVDAANKEYPTPSGQGLHPGDPGYAGTYKENMQQIINKIKDARAQPVLAKVPYVKGSEEYRNTLIQQYNMVVDELIAGNSISVSPPDFYTHFQNHQDLIHSINMFTDDYPDNIHPTHDGYQAMADLWFNMLTQ
jgi:lysophospholipase L1-like esterase